nr:ATP-binding protein [Actinomycetota bacterium]
MEVLLLLFVLFALVSLVSRAARRRAQRAAERQLEFERAVDSGEVETGAGSPFAMFPFGGVLEELMRSQGLSRSYTIDPETGEWVEITDQEPEPLPEPERAPQPVEGASSSDRRSEAKRRRRASTAAKESRSRGPFSMLGGMGGMPSDGSGEFEVQSPEELTSFADVGGMETLKQEVRDTVGLMLEHPDDAERYGIEWNGILLHGPPGVGKTYFAEAIAGEYEMSFIHVSTGDLVASLVGGSARNIEKAFDTALKHLPCLLFFDEFDSVAQRRDSTPDQESRRTVNQLLTSLEAHRDERRLLVLAATNSVEHLDPAAIRPGRFDRHIRIDLPDAAARR